MELTLDNYLKQHEADAEPGELTSVMTQQAALTVDKARRLLDAYVADGGQLLGLRSGWRPNKTTEALAGAHLGDAHNKCEGVDIDDNDRAFGKWCRENKDTVLADLGFYLENIDHTPGWVHVQIYAPHSGNREFLP